MRHLMQQCVAARLEVLETLTQLTPTTSFIAIVFLRVEIVLGLICREKQRADLHFAGCISVLRLRIRDGKAGSSLAFCVVGFSAADGEGVWGVRVVVVGCHQTPQRLCGVTIFRSEVMGEAGDQSSQRAIPNFVMGRVAYGVFDWSMSNAILARAAASAKDVLSFDF